MRCRGLLLGALVALAFGQWAGRADAGDNVRLVIKGNTSSNGQLVTPDTGSGDDTLAVRWYGGGRGYYGGGRGYYGGYYGRGYYGYGRAYYYPRYAGYYYPRYAAYYYNPYSYGSYYYAPSTYYYYASPAWSGCYRIGLGDEVAPVETTISPSSLASRPPQPAPNYLPAPRPVGDQDETFPYDGGPRNPIPAPRSSDPAPSATPRQAVPLEGKPVSLPAKTTQFAYPAYGEDATKKPAKPTAFAADQLPEPKVAVK
jgi:hypothetical protein